MADRRSVLNVAVTAMQGFTRPDVQVLPETALVPERNLVTPPPNQFTHRLTRAVPFSYGLAASGVAPDGELATGAPVVLMVHDGGDRCRVVDARGLYVEVEHAALAPVEP